MHLKKGEIRQFSSVPGKRQKVRWRFETDLGRKEDTEE